MYVYKSKGFMKVRKMFASVLNHDKLAFLMPRQLSFAVASPSTGV